MAWRLPDGRTISTPQDVLVGNTYYPSEIFYKWSILELDAIGIKPFREEKYDEKWFRSSGYTDVEIDGELVRQHTTVERYTEATAKERKAAEIRAVYLSEMPRATIMEDFYDAVSDADTKKLWSDYITALKNDAKTLKDAVDLAGTYDDIITLDFTWTPAPDVV